MAQAIRQKEEDISAPDRFEPTKRLSEDAEPASHSSNLLPAVAWEIECVLDLDTDRELDRQRQR